MPVTPEPTSLLDAFAHEAMTVGARPRGHRLGGANDPLAIGLVGTYPPTRCGIATFTASLARAMATDASGIRLGVVNCADAGGTTPRRPEVVAEVIPGSSASREAAAEALDEFDVVLLQHEYGIFGGEDGEEVLDLVDRLSSPLIVVLHTVLLSASPRQRAILEGLAEAARFVVTQSLSARGRLLDTYAVDPRRVRVIPHGATVDPASGGGVRDPVHAPSVLTWGLLGPGKGIELGIEAMARLTDLSPRPQYVVLGQTHPKERFARGEAYRESLVELVDTLGVDDRVEFDDAYRPATSMLGRIGEVDVVLLPYRSREQVVSGVLVEAIAAGKPVVATRFPHAVELLTEGSGLLVAHDDAGAIAAALRSFFTDATLARRLAAAAREQAPTFSWDTVGRAYQRLAYAAARERIG